MTFTQTHKGVINMYKMVNNRRVVIISQDTEAKGKSVTATCYTNNGETPCHSKSYKTLNGAKKYGSEFLANA